MAIGRPSVRWSEGGTAAMEMLMVLPFLLLLLVLIVNMGAGWLIKIKTNAAARFAATTFVHVPKGRDTNGEVIEAVRTYYSSLERTHIQLGGRIEPSLNGTLGFQPGRGSESFTARLTEHSSRRSIDLEVTRRPVVGATIFEERPTYAFFVVGGKPWTYDQVPLSASGVLDLAVEFGSAEVQGGGVLGYVFGTMSFLFGYAFKGFFWILGMVP